MPTTTLLTQAMDEIERRFQILAELPPETHTEADTLLSALAMLLAGELETMQEQVRVTKIIARYRKIKGMGDQPLKKTETIV